MGTFFDNLILIIGVLGRSGVGVPFNIWGYELEIELVSLISNMSVHANGRRNKGSHTWFETKTDSGPTSANTP